MFLKERIEHERRDVSALKTLDLVFNLLLLLEKCLILLLADKPCLVSLFGKSRVCVVLPEQQAVFGARGHHSVRLVSAFCDEIVDQRADIALRARKYQRILAAKRERGVKPCN